jgi:hypothetical protein
MNSLVPWKKRRDRFQEGDNVSGCGDQVDQFDDMESPGLTGSLTTVKFIMKDETNAEAMKAFKSQWWQQKPNTKHIKQRR